MKWASLQLPRATLRLNESYKGHIICFKMNKFIFPWNSIKSRWLYGIYKGIDVKAS